MIGHPVRRLVHTFGFAGRQLRNALADASLFVHRWTGGPALRESNIDGMRLLVRADEDSGRNIYFYKNWETDESRFLRREMMPTDICLDIGANIGFYSLLFSTCAPAGQVHAFEPVDLNYHLLCANVLLNRRTNTIVNRCAVGDVEAPATFTVASDSAFSSFLDTGRSPAVARTTVQVLTLDSYRRTKNLPRVDILKVDVEGAEGRVLSGAAHLLQDPERSPRLMMLELYDPMLNKYDTSIDDILSTLGGYGYSPFVLSGEHKVPFAREHYNRFYNVFFTQRS